MPYLRLWVNSFNYKSLVKRKDFVIDFLLLILTTCILLGFLFLFKNYIKTYIIILIPMLHFYFLFIPLAYKRIKDTGNFGGLAFCSIFIILLYFIIGICLFKSNDCLDKEKFKKMNDKRLNILSLPLLGILLLVILLIVGTIGYDVLCLKDSSKVTYLITDVSEYDKECNKVKNASKMMPKLEELSDYQELKFSSQENLYSTFLGFYSNGVSLFVSYNLNYDVKKEELDKYCYLESPIYSDNYAIIPLTTFEYNGYVYRIILDEEFNSCKSFMLIGYNDFEKEIVYHHYYNIDIDYICEIYDDYNEEMKNFMEECFYYFN